MVLPKRKIVLAVLLASVLAVLCVDRLLLGSASAGVDSPAAAAAAGNAQAAVAAPPPPVAGLAAQQVSLAERLGSLAAAGNLDSAAVRDAFLPAASWLAQAPTAKREADGGDLQARKFLEKHRLRATAVTAGVRIALIDDQCIEVGQVVDGFRLIAVGPAMAELACGEVRVTLHLDKLPGR